MIETEQEAKDRKYKKNREWRLKNPDKVREYSKRSREKTSGKNKDKNREYHRMWRERNKGHRRNYHLFSKYGLTADAFDSMFLGQGKSCAICGSLDFGKRGPIVDHNHETGEIRGILCNRCNVCIGQLDDNCALLQRAADYLKKAGS